MKKKVKSQKSKVKSQSGFTLIELMMVVVLLAVIGVMGVALFSSSLKGNSKATAINEMKQNGSYALSIMERVIRNASQVEASVVCDGSNPNLSSIKFLNSDSSFTEFQFQSTGGGTPYYRIVRIDTVGGVLSSSFLTSNNVAAKCATIGGTCTQYASYFQCVDTGIDPKTINIVFTLTQSQSNLPQEFRAEVPFQTSLTLRNQ